MNEYCVGNIDGQINIYIPTLSVGLSSIINRPIFSNLNQKINVECKKLDTYCKENNINEIVFLKIDVEGTEKNIFEADLEILKDRKIKCGIF